LGVDDGIGVGLSCADGGAGRAGGDKAAVIPLDALALVGRGGNQAVLFAAVYIKYLAALVALAKGEHGRRGDGALVNQFGDAQLLAVGDAAGVGADIAGFGEHPAGAGFIVEHQLRPAIAGGGLVNAGLEAGVAGVGAGAAGVADGIALGVDVVGGVDGSAGAGDLHPEFVSACFGRCPSDIFGAAADQFDALGVADGGVDLGAGWRCRHSGGQVTDHQQQRCGELADGLGSGAVLLHGWPQIFIKYSGFALTGRVI